MRGVPICQNIDLSSSHASFGPNGKCGKGGNERPRRDREGNKKKTTRSFNFENIGYIFSGRVKDLETTTEESKN